MRQVAWTAVINQNFEHCKRSLRQRVRYGKYFGR